MNYLDKFLEIVAKLSMHSERLVPLILSVAVLAAIIVIGMQRSAG
ncbi:hypothetical protein C8R21_1483 [Nitrosospira multiformis]|uniref:Uncharacterized protein n=1 Tax=Nitrosospira multiformis TaxID=1231 RepID=A0A2T5I1W8_9PROT|nr:hypothetical protein C8R21_1483 [Nitrosospira multiformis]